MNTANSTGRVQAKWILGIVILAVLVWVGVAVSDKAPAETGPVKIGVVAALSGDLAWLGEEHRNAVQYAVDDINERGGINGRPIELFVEDGKCSGKDAVSAAQKLIDVNNVVVIFGGSCSSETLAMAPVTEANKKILFTSWALSPDVREAGDYVFRNVPADDVAASAIADLARQHGVNKIAVVTEQLDYAQAYRKAFVARFDADGGTIVSDEFFQTNERTFQTVVDKMLAESPDAVLINAQGVNVGLLAREIRSRDTAMPLYGNVHFLDTQVLAEFGEALEGGYVSEPVGIDESNDAIQEYLIRYEQKFDAQVTAPFWTLATTDAVYLVAKAVEAFGTDASKIRDYLYGVKYKGILQDYSFDEKGDVLGAAFANKQLRGGKAVTL